MIGMHSLARTDVEALATGFGGADLVRRLWEGQHSRRLRWVWQVIDQATGPGCDEAQVALVRAAEQAPDAVGELLVQPMVGAWASALLRSGTSPDVSQVGALAVSAALRARTAATAAGLARSGWVLLPGSGMVRADSGTARLATDGGRLWVNDREIAPGDDWRRPRRVRITGAPPLEFAVEDADPHRDRFQVAPTDRLSAEALAEWTDDLARGWDLISRRSPDRAAEIAAGLASIVPLSKPDAGAAHSATSTTTVGVIGLDRPTDPAELVVTIVHEFQHSKLAALHDVEPLHRSGPEPVFRVPWRTDRRPLSGALQGLYAFLGVADAWLALRAEPRLTERAEMRFAEAVAFVREPAQEIATADRLTPTGRRFADGVAGAVEALLSVPVSPTARSAAERSLAAHRAGWEA